MAKKIYVNPFLFIKIKKDKIDLYDYLNQKCYRITNQILMRLCNIQKQKIYRRNNQLDSTLFDNNLISFESFKQGPWKWDSISHIFHFGTRHGTFPDVSSTKEYWEEWLKSSRNLSKKVFPPILPPNVADLPIIKLPQIAKKQVFSMPLWEVLQKRKTSRVFKGKEIKLEELAALLKITFGITHPSQKKSRIVRRTSPSGGSLHPTMPYVLVLKVAGLRPGVYFYDFLNHQLRLIEEIDLSDQMGNLLGGHPFVQNISAGIIMTSRFDRLWFKYTNSGSYRLLLLDIGHLSQTLLLSATSLGLQTWLTGALDYSKLEKILKINTQLEAAQFFVGIGHGKNQAIDVEELLKIKETNPSLRLNALSGKNHEERPTPQSGLFHNFFS